MWNSSLKLAFWEFKGYYKGNFQFDILSLLHINYYFETQMTILRFAIGNRMQKRMQSHQMPKLAMES